MVFWKKLINIRRNGRAEYDDIIKNSKDEVPIVKDMAKLKYDAVVLGDNEFVSNDKQSLDKLVSDFKIIICHWYQQIYMNNLEKIMYNHM